MKTQDRPEIKSEEKSAESSDGQGENGKPVPKKRPFIWIAAVILVIASVIYGMRFYAFSKTHASTDDAYIASNVVQIAPQVNGTVIKVFVHENDHVKAGQVLALIDPATYQQAVDQAKANLDLALAQVGGANSSTALTRSQGNAQIEQAKGVVTQSGAGEGAAVADVSRAAAAVSGARANAQGANAGIANANAAIASATAQESRNRAAILGAVAAVDAANNGVASARANLSSATASYTKAHSDNARARVLYSQGAISAQQYDAFKAADQMAKSAMDAAEQAVRSSQSGVAQAQANLDAAREALVAAQASVSQARAQRTAAQAQFRAANDTVNQAYQLEVQSRKNVLAAIGKVGQAKGQLDQAKTVSQEVAVNVSNVSQARAKVEQAKAAYRQALLNLEYTTVKSPSDGQVTKKSVTNGSLVQIGSPLMALVPDEIMWVEANFKETQLQGVQPGQTAEIEVDAVPGHTYTGKVDSVSRGTGATFALLPPDNATGNFTKVVQRVPVRITFDPNQPNLDQLRSGMSAVATVNLK